MLTELMGLALIGTGLAIKSRFRKANEDKPLFEQAEIPESKVDGNDKIIDLEEYREKLFLRRERGKNT